MTSFNLWGHIFVDPHVIRWWDPTNANTNLWQDLGLGWQGLWMPKGGSSWTKFCETCTTLDQTSPGLQRHPRGKPLQKRGIFSGCWVVGSLGRRFFILWIPFLWAPGSFMQISGSGSWSWHFLLYFPKVQGAICVQPPYVYVQTIAMLVNAWVSNGAWCVSTCLPRSITVCYIMLHPAISPAILEFPVIAAMLFRCFEIPLLAESQVNNIVTAVSFGMTLGVTVSVVLNLVQPGSHRSSWGIMQWLRAYQTDSNVCKHFPVIFPQSFLQATSSPFLCLVTVWGRRYDLVRSLRHGTARMFVKSSPRTCRMCWSNSSWATR